MTTKKNTVASYKADFKYSIKDSEGNDQEFTIEKFSRNPYAWGQPNELSLSNFDNAILKIARPDLFIVPEGKSYWQVPANEVEAKDKFAMLEGNPAYDLLDAAFVKWSERRQGLREVFANIYPNEQFSVYSLAAHHWDKKFLRALEKNRPVKFNVGQLVTIANNASKHLYDPFYYKRGLEDKPRIGVVTKWTDETGRRAGAGSREMRIMWLASGDLTQIPVRLLRAWERPEENSETASA